MFNMMLIQLVTMALNEGCEVTYNDSRVGKFGINSETLKPTILIPLDTPELITLVDTAHEYGHWKQFCHWDKDIEIFRSYITETPITIIEGDAWERAAVVLHDLGFTQWEEFNNRATSCMGTYYNEKYSFIEVIDKMHQFALRLRKHIDSIREVTYA